MQVRVLSWGPIKNMSKTTKSTIRVKDRGAYSQGQFSGFPAKSHQESAEILEAIRFYQLFLKQYISRIVFCLDEYFDMGAFHDFNSKFHHHAVTSLYQFGE